LKIKETDTVNIRETATTSNPRTAAQNRHLYWLFERLNIHSREAIADIVWQFTEGRTAHTSELQFLECMELIKYLTDILKSSGRRPTKSERTEAMPADTAERQELDRKRKGVLKAIFRYGELQGYTYTMEYVKAIACRAAGVDRFNDISSCALARLYHEFCKKQKALEIKRDIYQPFGLN
jgi:hypothetical protein